MNKTKLKDSGLSKRVLFLFLLFCVLDSFSQSEKKKNDLIIPLDTAGLNKIYHPVIHQPSISQINLNNDSLSGISVFKFELQPFQSIYSKYSNNRVGINEMKYAFNITKIRRIHYDTSRLNSKPLKGAIVFLIKIDKDGKVIMCPNVNNDNDYTNDTSVVLGNVNEKRIVKRVVSFQFRNIEMADNSRGIITVNPHITFNINEVADSTVKGLVKQLQIKSNWIKIIQNNYRIGKTVIDKHDYFIVTNASLSGNVYDEQCSNQLSIFDNLDSVTNNGIYKSERYFIGDTVFLMISFF